MNTIDVCVCVQTVCVAQLCLRANCLQTIQNKQQLYQTYQI